MEVASSAHLQSRPSSHLGAGWVRVRLAKVGKTEEPVFPLVDRQTLRLRGALGVNYRIPLI